MRNLLDNLRPKSGNFSIDTVYADLHIFVICYVKWIIKKLKTYSIFELKFLRLWFC